MYTIHYNLSVYAKFNLLFIFRMKNVYTFFHLIDFSNIGLCLVLYTKIFFTPASQKLVTAST